MHAALVISFQALHLQMCRPYTFAAFITRRYGSAMVESVGDNNTFNTRLIERVLMPALWRPINQLFDLAIERC